MTEWRLRRDSTDWWKREMPNPLKAGIFLGFAGGPQKHDLHGVTSKVLLNGYVPRTPCWTFKREEGKGSPNYSKACLSCQEASLQPSHGDRMSTSLAES